MDERENSSQPTPAAPTTALPTVEPEHPKLVKNRGPALAFLILAIVVVVGLVLAVFAMIYSANRSTSSGYIGSWGSGMQSLTISADGEALGTDGCNGQSSRWTMRGDRIEFEGFIGTLIACLGPNDRLMNGWLGQSASAKLDPADPNRLIFFGQNGEELGSMVRGAVPEPMRGRPMPTGEPMLPGPDDPTVPGPADDGDALVYPRPGAEFPEPRPMLPELPNSGTGPERDSDSPKFP